MSSELDQATQNKQLPKTTARKLTWPTSKPGPGTTPPPPGQRPVRTRTDQVVELGYDQERGEPTTRPAG